MRDSKLSRRDMLRASTVLAAGAVFAEPLAAAAPEPTPLRPAMIQAARKEGMVAFYTAMAIPVAENLGKAFEANGWALHQGGYLFRNFFRGAWPQALRLRCPAKPVRC